MLGFLVFTFSIAAYIYTFKSSLILKPSLKINQKKKISCYIFKTYYVFVSTFFGPFFFAVYKIHNLGMNEQ